VIWPDVGGLAWSHGGYNPGAQTYFYCWPQGFCFAFLFNGTGPDTNPTAAVGAISPEIWDTLLPISDWPAGDLFPTFYPPRIANAGVVNAASFRTGPVAPDSLFTVMGVDLGGDGSGASLLLRDAGGAEHPLTLTYSGPQQLNALMPGDTAVGDATVIVRRAGWPDASAPITIANVSPGIFTMNADGLAAAEIVRTKSGQQSMEYVFQVDGSGKVVAKPITFGDDDEVLTLVLYGTGIRGRGTDPAIQIGATTPPAFYAGSQNQFAGLDQTNIDLPRSLAGAGDVAVTVTVDGQSSNAAHLFFQ